MSELGQVLLSVYGGRTDVHGVQTAKVWIDEAGERHKDATWLEVDQAVTDDLVDRHLAGKTTIGLYLLRPDSMCAFCVWDFDGGDKASVELVRRVLREREIDHLLFDSGKKGYHVVAVFAAPVAGDIAHRFARAILDAAGTPEKVEAFPKQGTVTPERPYGNLIKLPLGVHRATNRRCALLSDTFTPVIEGTETDELAGLRRVPVKVVTEIAGTAPAAPSYTNGVHGHSVTSSGFVHVPYPCFADLSTANYGDGERNALLFTLTKHLQRQGQPRAFAELVVGTQAGRCLKDGRPYPYEEWPGIVDRVYTQGFTSMGCEDSAMRGFCKGAICPLYQRLHDVPPATNPDPDAPEQPANRLVSLENLLQIGRDEPQYEVTVCGQRIEGLDADTLFSWTVFSKTVMARLRFIPELPSVRGTKQTEVWRALVNDALSASILEERPGNATEGADVVDAALDWLRHSATLSENRADVFKGALWQGEDGNGVIQTYFVPRFLLQGIRGRIGPISNRSLYDGLRRNCGASGTNIRIDKQTAWVWCIPADVLAQTL